MQGHDRPMMCASIHTQSHFPSSKMMLPGANHLQGRVTPQGRQHLRKSELNF